MSATEKIVSILAILFGVFILLTDDSTIITGICRIIFNFFSGLIGI